MVEDTGPAREVGGAAQVHFLRPPPSCVWRERGLVCSRVRQHLLTRTSLIYEAVLVSCIETRELLSCCPRHKAVLASNEAHVGSRTRLTELSTFLTYCLRALLTID